MVPSPLQVCTSVPTQVVVLAGSQSTQPWPTAQICSPAQVAPVWKWPPTQVWYAWSTQRDCPALHSELPASGWSG